MSDTPTAPLRATKHCRHYSYHRDKNQGPHCAVGCDMSAPGSAMKCMAEANGDCTKRQEYTEAEHADWESWQETRWNLMTVRMSGIKEPLPTRMALTYKCPCGKGTAKAERGIKRVYVNCTCDLGEIQINIGHSGEWPKREKTND